MVELDESAMQNVRTLRQMVLEKYEEMQSAKEGEISKVF